MAIGDDAAAAGLALVAGSVQANTIDTEINKTRDYIAQRTSTVTPIAKGGTNATTAAQARTNLDVPKTSDVVATSAVGAGDFATPGKIPIYNGSGQLTSAAPSLSGHVVPLGTLQGGFTTFGDVFLPNATPAVSGYTIMYLNSDGRVSKGASSERFKKFISHILPSSLGNIWPQLHRFQMRSLDGTADGTWRYGYIAERLHDDPELARFVIYDADGLPESIDFIALGIVQTAELNERVVALEARLAALEGS